MKLKNQRVYLNLLNKKIKMIKEPKWEYLYNNHLKQSLNLFNIAKVKSNDLFFRDSISRANKVFEGVVRLLYDLARSLDHSVKVKQNNIYNYIDELLSKGKIPNIFGSKLDDYRDIYRNPETHEIFRDFGEKKAKITLNEALVFLNIGLDNYNLISQNKIPINDKDYLNLIFKSFIETFALFSEFFHLYEKTYNGIYSEKIDVLLGLIRYYYDNSLFINEFSLNDHPIVQRLKPHFKVTLSNYELTFTVIKISDYDLMHRSSVFEIRDRIKNYLNTFSDPFFLIWSFTNRRRLTEILEIFNDIPHFHLSGLKRKIENLNSFLL